jgi:lysophospholipase L1-like esterase
LPKHRIYFKNKQERYNDIYSALVGKPELFKDGLHPNAEGTAIIAETVYGAIRDQ